MDSFFEKSQKIKLISGKVILLWPFSADFRRETKKVKVMTLADFFKKKIKSNDFRNKSVMRHPLDENVHRHN